MPEANINWGDINPNQSKSIVVQTTLSAARTGNVDLVHALLGPDVSGEGMGVLTRNIETDDGLVPLWLYFLRHGLLTNGEADRFTQTFAILVYESDLQVVEAYLRDVAEADRSSEAINEQVRAARNTLLDRLASEYENQNRILPDAQRAEIMQSVLDENRFILPRIESLPGRLEQIRRKLGQAQAFMADGAVVNDHDHPIRQEQRLLSRSDLASMVTYCAAVMKAYEALESTSFSEEAVRLMGLSEDAVRNMSQDDFLEHLAGYHFIQGHNQELNVTADTCCTACDQRHTLMHVAFQHASEHTASVVRFLRERYGLRIDVLNAAGKTPQQLVGMEDTDPFFELVTRGKRALSPYLMHLKDHLDNYVERYLNIGLFQRYVRHGSILANQIHHARWLEYKEIAEAIERARYIDHDEDVVLTIGRLRQARRPAPVHSRLFDGADAVLQQYPPILRRAHGEDSVRSVEDAMFDGQEYFREGSAVLNRVRDAYRALVHERDDQIRQLQEQLNQAIQQKQAMEIELRRDIRQRQTQVDALLVQVRQLRETVSEQDAEIHNLGQDLERFNQDNTRLRQENDQLEGRITELEQRVQEYGRIARGLQWMFEHAQGPNQQENDQGDGQQGPRRGFFG